jgi:hypothetical protein
MKSLFLKSSILFMCLGIVQGCVEGNSNKTATLTDRIRLEAIQNDTLTCLKAYKNIQLGKPIEFADNLLATDTTVWSASGTQQYRNRMAKLYQKVGNMLEVYDVYGYRWEAEYYGVNNLQYRQPYIYETVMRYLDDEPTYGELEIDKLLDETTKVGPFILELIDENQNSEYKKLTGWFQYKEDKGIVYNIKCVFDYFALTQDEFNRYTNSIITGLSQKYGQKYSWNNTTGYYYSNEYAWLVGKFEIHFCTRQGARYDSERSSYEFIIEYVDNSVLIRQKEEYLKEEREKEQADSIQQSQEQTRLKAEYESSML